MCQVLYWIHNYEKGSQIDFYLKRLPTLSNLLEYESSRGKSGEYQET